MSLPDRSVCSRAAIAASMLVMVSASVADAWAQSVSGQIPPPRQVVVNPTARVAGSNGLWLNASAFEAYDRNDVLGLTSTTSTATTAIFRRTGTRSGGDASLNYSYAKQWARAAFGANGRAGANVYSSSSRVLTRANGGFHVTLPIGRRSTAAATYNLAYAPYYNFGIFPELNAAVDPGDLAAATDADIDLAVVSNQRTTHAASANFSHQLTKRSSMSFTSTYRLTDFSGATPDLTERQIGGRFSQQLTQNLGVHVGYGYGRGIYRATTTAQRPELHNIDVGLDFGKRLSFSFRQTTFAFTMGSQLMADSRLDASPGVDRRYFRITGSASATRDLGRTWAVRMNYRRGWQFVDSLATPIFVDSVTAGIGGAPSRRSSVGISASYLHGAFGASSTRPGGNNAYRATAMYRLRLLDWCSGYVQYAFYRFEIPAATAVLADFPSGLTRNGARAGLAIGVPLFR